MKLSHLQNPRRERLSSHGYETKSRYQLAQIKAPVEPITKFCQIPGEMFFADSMAGSSQRVLHVTDYGVDPFEFRDLHTFRATSGDDCGMVIASSANGIEATKAIGDNVGFWSQMMSSPSFNSFQGE
jgi:hypothetical protein